MLHRVLFTTTIIRASSLTLQPINLADEEYIVFYIEVGIFV